MKNSNFSPHDTFTPQRISVWIPMRTERGQNNREHHMQRHRRVKAERATVLWALFGRQKLQLPCAVLLTRITPSAQQLDSDNLQGSLKAIRDAVASWLGADDGGPLVQWDYAQEKRPGQWGVQLEINSGADDGNR